MKWRAASTLMMLLVLSTAASAVVETHPDYSGWVNWERQVVKAIGLGVPPGDMESPALAALVAREIALSNARRNLTSTIGALSVGGETCVKDLLSRNDESGDRIQAAVLRATIVSEKQLHDRSFEVILQLALAGERGLMPELLPHISTPTHSASDRKALRGVIIDAGGLDIKPALSPRILGEDGEELYSACKADPPRIVESGLAAYFPNMEKARKSPRAGSRPFVIKALKPHGESPTDIVVSSADAHLLKEVERKYGALSLCMVSVVAGSPRKQDANRPE